VVFLIPDRIGIIILAWWFDWLPHHGLADTQRSNRYRATRVRVGMEWLFTPLMLSLNYHLVHHLHPSVPFYRYVKTWRRNEEAYLEREAAISTVFGQQLNPEEFREWKRLNRKLGRLVLEGVLQVRSDAPYACMGGACGTCRAKLLEGTVQMVHNFALGQQELDAGYVLTCQSHPTSPNVAIDYDA
jgi:ferredoxin